MWAVGARYHPKDLYNDFLNQVVTIYVENTGEVQDSYALFEVLERQVESRGDGTGEYIWPRQQRKDGKWFGFDTKELNRIKAQYIDKAKFYAQYYNDPNDPGNKRITNFNYYNRDNLICRQGRWALGDIQLNVFAAIDFAAMATVS